MKKYCSYKKILFLILVTLCIAWVSNFKVHATEINGISFGFYYWNQTIGDDQNLYDVDLLKKASCGYDDYQLADAWNDKKEPVVFSYKGKTYTIAQQAVERISEGGAEKTLYSWNDMLGADSSFYFWDDAKNIFTDKDKITLLSAPSIPGYEPMFLNREFTMINYGGDNAFRFFFPIVYRKKGETVDLSNLPDHYWKGWGVKSSWEIDLDTSPMIQGDYPVLGRLRYYPYTGKQVKPEVYSFAYGLYTLKPEEDYTISYINNVNPAIKGKDYKYLGPISNPGTTRPAIVVTGKGEYTGSVYYGFSIYKEEYNAAKTLASQINVSGISHNIAAGKKIRLTATVAPANATNKALKWTSSNTKVATVNQKGLVTIKKKTGGKSVTIKATAADGSGKTATWKIKVMKGVVKKVSISGKTSVKAGKTIKLKAKVTASKGANKKLKWTSSNKKYATVNGSGKVKGLKAGKGKTVKITAMATDGSGKKAVKKIKIK